MSASRWTDLRPRMISAAVLIGLALGAVWIGGFAWRGFISLACGIMVWELVRMVDTARDRSAPVLGLVAGVCAIATPYLPPALALPLLLLPSMAGFGRMERGGVTYAVFTALILLAGYGFMKLRADFGLVWMLWLVCVVVITDVGGYFAGRMIGGPKLWPRVSPKKTWSGAVAGWIGAAIVGLIFAGTTHAGVGLMGISVAISMASQIGDLAESTVKRRAGVKDSSNLLPGHGGLLDRFDGMLGAALFLLIAGQIVDFPPGLE
ncbi:phosphatidate cytidylyltransferase [Salipiger aestuarii]|uniref:Phosphatidate cytidylyltransferase n=1 Tax=Salipiger aestuarii TaxID=568098 RepID=A0A327XNT0_9RHOB|nr:phosphatidate cytidylyltransferase [Salipiger aestuarii]EIE52578.1 phosphatidate cytidylyltransferase [Citreicella sp. 357]KAA8605599.1 phosphatidate cytidylyltransferase [Salipiger aestuarii]KAA8608156.1 phosphatidate cytidylyltransferase [Salipiger aestuarii]KAB2539362.1 phosphatidate cytidylyltransferase [Salipiger aestuarii]RAK10480.1 phosphatidate cytidylyltransferase [Salipiger aestuarii]